MFNSLRFKFSQSAEVYVQENYVELEMDALNKHECMAPLIALIKHMVDNKISPEVVKVKPGHIFVSSEETIFD